MKINIVPPRNIIGDGCKEFRKKVLKLSLDDLSKKTNINLSTISAFENGNSTNINHLFMYLHLCESTEQEELFFNMLNEKFRVRFKIEQILFNHQAK